MKKRMYLMLLMLLLSIGGIVYSAAALSRAQTQVELYPTTLAGDPKAARGLSLHYGAGCNEKLLWETDYAIGGEPESSFSFDRDRVQYPARHPISYRGADLRFDGLSFIASGFPSRPEEAEDNYWGAMTPLILDVAERTAPGTEHREVLRLGDYLDSYPLNASLTFYGEYMPLLSLLPPEGYEEALSRFSGAFSFPISEEHCVAAAVIRNSDGSYEEFEISTALPETVGDVQDLPWMGDASAGQATHTEGVSIQEEPVSIHTVSTEYRDFSHTAEGETADFQWIYFVVEARDKEGKLLDYSRTPGGYALYRIPLSGGKQDPMTSVERLETVTALDPETEVLALEISHDQNELYMITGTETDAVLHILDAATGREEQSFPTVLSENRWYHIETGEDFVLICADWSLRLYRREADGTYTEAIAADLEVGTYDFVLNGCLDVSYDGERLALVYEAADRWIHQDTYWSFDVGFNVLVCDSQGLRYAGSFDHSLNHCPSADGRSMCTREDPLVELSWS